MLVKTAALLTLLAGLTVSPAVAATPAPAPISSCDTFQTWFRLQPGAKLAFFESANAPAARPKKIDTILDYALPIHAPNPAYKAGMKAYRGIYGGGGCLGGYYDATTASALILATYDTASALIITKTAPAPVGLPSHPVVQQTRNGAAIGMTLAQVRAIEGTGTLTAGAGGQVLSYNQDSGKPGSPGGAYGWLRFLFQHGVVTAIGVGAGE